MEKWKMLCIEGRYYYVGYVGNEVTGFIVIGKISKFLAKIKHDMRPLIQRKLIRILEKEREREAEEKR